MFQFHDQHASKTSLKSNWSLNKLNDTCKYACKFPWHGLDELDFYCSAACLCPLSSPYPQKAPSTTRSYIKIFSHKLHTNSYIGLTQWPTTTHVFAHFSLSSSSQPSEQLGLVSVPFQENEFSMQIKVWCKPGLKG